jgi:hypothetical protein
MTASDRYSPRMDQLQQTLKHLDRWFANPKLAQKTPESCDFLFGNPHDMPLPGFVEALADILAGASQRHNRPIYLISDESYRRIVFDDRIYNITAKQLVALSDRRRPSAQFVMPSSKNINRRGRR